MSVFYVLTSPSSQQYRSNISSLSPDLAILTVYLSKSIDRSNLLNACCLLKPSMNESTLSTATSPSINPLHISFHSPPPLDPRRPTYNMKPLECFKINEAMPQLFMVLNHISYFRYYAENMYLVTDMKNECPFITIH